MVTDTAAADRHHGVQFYDSDEVLGRRVVSFIAEGLDDGALVIVLATEAHQRVFADGLARRGVDAAAAIRDGRLVVVDAEQLLAQVMIGGAPDPLRFEREVATLLDRTPGEHRQPIRAYGELVDLLVRGGMPQAALELERMWNELARRVSFDLLCAYALEPAGPMIEDICALHDHLTGTDDVARPDPEHARLLREIARRNEVEAELREANRALQQAQEAERARAARILRLQHATAALGSAVSLGEVTEAILATSDKIVGATAAVVYLRDADGVYRVQGARGLPRGYARWRELALDAPVPLARALATQTAVWVESHAQLVEAYAGVAAAGIDASRLQAIAALPLQHGTRPVGGLALSFATVRVFHDDDREWLESFAAQCALAVERARLYEAEQQARAEAQTLYRVAESLSDARLDLEAILQRVTDEATLLVGADLGAFFYNTTAERADSYLLYTLSGAPKEAFAKLGMPRTTPLLAHTFRDGAVVRIDDARADPRFGASAAAGLPFGHLAVASYLAVPVTTRTGEVLGALLFAHAERARFTAQHERLARALASTAGVAIENAELYRARRDGEDAQRRLVEQLVETVHMNELFTGVLAHDLRNPLAAVMTAAQLVLHRTGDEAQQRPLRRILASTQRMGRMIEQLLDFTRLRIGGGLPLEPAACDLAPLLAHVVDELRDTHPRHAIRVTATGDTHGTWDADRLGQAFSNLLGNAAQHGGPDGGVDVGIDGADPARVRIQIRNPGAIPDALLPRIFEPMIGGQRRRDGSRGLGLGLFITHEIAKGHGGRIEVESSEAAGTTFTLTLPRATPVAAPVASAPLASSVAQAKERAWETEQRMRLLVDSVRDYAIFMLDAEARVASWNPTSEALSGFSRDVIYGQPAAALFPPDEASALELELRRAAELGGSERIGWLVRRDGSRFWATTTISVIRDTTDRIVGYATVIRDLTAQREARDKLARSEQRTKLFIDSVRDYAIFMLDARGCVHTWNRGAEIAKGYAAHEIIGQHMSIFYPREDREAGRPQRLLQRAVEDGRVEDLGWRVRKDGSRFWADVVITALRDDQGELYGFAKVTRDLSERRIADEELRRSEERFRLLVEAVKDYAIYMIDATGHIVTWNAGAERIKGYKASEIVGQHVSRFYDPEEVRAGACERELEIAARDGRFEEEAWRIRKDGTRFWASVVITALRDAKGELLGFSKVTRDLTQRRRLEDERLQLVQAQEGIRLRDEFLAIVSHELKTPLAGLLLQLDALRGPGAIDDPKLRDKLARARESGGRLHALIDNLLDVSRIASGPFTLTAEALDLAALVRDTVGSFRSAAAKAGCELVVRASTPVEGTWDRARLGQVVTQLVSNAIKYGAGRPIEVGVAREGHEVLLEVRDHGPGIAPADATRVFERFERAVSHRHYGGLGIGLYVVREIVVAHGGTVAAHNAPDGGAIITVRLPVEGAR